MSALATMSASAFLMVYVGISALVVLIGWAWSRAADTSLERGLPRVDVPLDPLKIAFMGRGVEGVARLVLHDMVARGYLEVRVEASVFKEELLVCAPKAQRPLGYLSPLEREVVKAADAPVGVDELMSRGLIERVAPFCAELEAELEREELVFGQQARGLRRNIWYMGIVALLAVAIARFVATFADAAPDTSWLAMIGVTLVAFITLGATTAQRRQTRLGERWMEAVKSELSGLRAMRAHRGLMTGRNELLLLAVFGPPRGAVKVSGAP